MLRSFAPVLSLQLVQSVVQCEYLMNARLGFAWAVAVVMRGCYYEMKAITLTRGTLEQ